MYKSGVINVYLAIIAQIAKNDWFLTPKTSLKNFVLFTSFFKSGFKKQKLAQLSEI